MTIFERIAAGEIPCHKVWEDHEFIAFLDIRPVARGHTLVVPKKAVDPLFAMESALYTRFWQAVRTVSEIISAKIPHERICVSVVGFEVPHVHAHLIPCQSSKDFPWPGGKEVSQDELRTLSKELRA